MQNPNIPQRGTYNKHIGWLTNYTPGTIATTLKLNTLQNDGKTCPCCSCPLKLTRRDRRLILRIIQRNPKLTYAQLKVKANVDVSKITLYQMLKDEGITNWLAKKRSLIAPEVAA